MQRSEPNSLLVTGFFVAVLTALIGVGVFSGTPEAEAVVNAELERYVPDVQFTQYLEYRARLEDASVNCR